MPSPALINITPVHVCSHVSPVDPKAGVAQALAHLHQRHRRGKSHQREPLSEQHDHSQAAQRGGLRFLEWPDDPGQGQAP